jgi:hypothetical protein
MLLHNLIYCSVPSQMLDMRTRVACGNVIIPFVDLFS